MSPSAHTAHLPGADHSHPRPHHQQRRQQSRSWIRWRPFYAACGVASFLIFASYVQTSILSQQHEPLGLYSKGGSPTTECRDVHHIRDHATPHDICLFVKTNCDDEQPGLIPYLTVYYCTFFYARIAGFTLLITWLGLLFSTIGIAASDFFTPNLQTIAGVLSMPENLTGVTFLAIGNGSPDLFSTVMSMRSNSAAMAVGELIGAASFITAIVAGSIVMISEFKVDKHSFVRDLVFFIVAVCLTLSFLLDGHLHFFECIIMIAYYAFYVIFVTGTHWHSSRRLRRATQAKDRARAVEDALEANGDARYQDQPAQLPPRTRAHALAHQGAYGSALSTPRIEVEDGEADEGYNEAARQRKKRIAAEIADNMRVRRPTISRRPTSAFIRPSLVGALELNSALEHFKKESGSQQDYIGHTRRHSVQNMPEAARFRAEAPAGPLIAVDTTSPPSRERAHSHTGNVVDALGHSSEPALPTQVLELRHDTTAGSPGTSRAPSRAASSTRSFQLDGNLAVPPVSPHAPSRQSLRPEPLHLQIPSRRSTASEHSDTLSPFPGYVESPMPMSPNSEAPDPLFELPQPIIPLSGAVPVGPGVEPEPDTPPHVYRWWPSSILPDPHDIMTTLFPTLQSWDEKTVADAFISVLSVPSVFLLSITLPVVDPRGSETEETSDCEANSDGSEPGWHYVEDEWELFREHRRNTVTSRPTLNYRSVTPRSPTTLDEGVALDMDRPVRPKLVGNPGQMVLGGLEERGREGRDQDLAAVSVGSDDGAGWNKWQVLIQALAGPPFSVFIIFNVLMEQPAEEVVRALKWSLGGSGLLFLTILLSTRADQKPRYFSFLCFPGFLVSVSWIAMIAGEVVGVLKAIGVIWGISEAILGLTIFAAGNSVGDWVSDYTIAKLGAPVMAL